MMSEFLPNRTIKIAGNVSDSTILAGDGNIILNDLPSLTPGKPIPFGIPYPRNPFFTGRKSVLNCLHQKLSQETAVAITQIQAISGLGGIGKTQTAVEYAWRYYYDQRIYEYVFWVKADTKANLTTDFANLAYQLALPVAKDNQAEKNLAVHAWLATHKNWLLIFDNADLPVWIEDFIPNNPTGKILITSRASIFDRLGIKQPITLDVLPSTEAVELLFRRTGYTQSDDELAAAIELNQLMDGLPLALEQACAFIVRRRILLRTYLNTYRKQGLSQLEKTKAQTGKYPSSVLKTWAINFQAVAEDNPISAELLKFSAFLAPDDIPYRILMMGPSHLTMQLPEELRLQAKVDDEDFDAIGACLEPLSQYSLVQWDGQL
ncbi:MAG: NB-ARC domain-containing protein [Cyanobacteria bacterium J06555_13]